MRVGGKRVDEGEESSILSDIGPERGEGTVNLSR